MAVQSITVYKRNKKPWAIQPEVRYFRTSYWNFPEGLISRALVKGCEALSCTWPKQHWWKPKNNALPLDSTFISAVLFESMYSCILKANYITCFHLVILEALGLVIIFSTFDKNYSQIAITRSSCIHVLFSRNKRPRCWTSSYDDINLTQKQKYKD